VLVDSIYDLFYKYESDASHGYGNLRYPHVESHAATSYTTASTWPPPSTHRPRTHTQSHSSAALQQEETASIANSARHSPRSIGPPVTDTFDFQRTIVAINIFPFFHLQRQFLALLIGAQFAIKSTTSADVFSSRTGCGVLGLSNAVETACWANAAPLFKAQTQSEGGKLEELEGQGFGGLLAEGV